MIDKETIKRRFSKSAKNYDQYANVQKSMGDVLIEEIKSKHKCFNRILEVGCGTGYVTKALIHHFPDANITAVDIAPGMIKHVQSTIQHENLELVCGDIEEIELKGKYDLIISNATFQWFNQLEKTMEKLVKSLEKDGILAFSTFGQDTFKELHESFRKAKESLNIQKEISPGQSFFSASTLRNLCSTVLTDTAITAKKVQVTESYHYEYFNSCKDFLYSVKKIGANNAQKEKSKTSFDFIKKVMETYDQDYQENHQVVATYHSIFVIIE